MTKFGYTYLLLLFALLAVPCHGASRKGAKVNKSEHLTFKWNRVSSVELPRSVKLFSCNTMIDDASVKMWYAIADAKSRDVEFFAGMSDKNITPTDFAKSLESEEVYIMVNGGYCGANHSYSYVKNRNNKLSDNVDKLGRSGKSYYVTRGVMGVDQSGAMQTKWSSPTSLYDKVLPVVEGDEVLIPNSDYPSVALSDDYYSAIGGSPVLVKDGRWCFNFEQNSDGQYLTNHELLQADIYAEKLRQPRTAMGYKGDKIIILIVDGRQPNVSEGVTLDQLTMIMTGLGCDNVLNLDGGGSTAMVATNGGVVINTPSNKDAEQRAVISFVGFVKRK